MSDWFSFGKYFHPWEVHHRLSYVSHLTTDSFSKKPQCEEIVMCIIECQMYLSSCT